ncbi:MAG TPA: PAS domain-containing sensor histidine kinase, partial [Ktedonosporobacter sp.]|nr:PAS domain-containing sensor histidine kinase [Ktedonosporobacter sp.]
MLNSQESERTHAPHESVPIQISSTRDLTQLLDLSPDPLLIISQAGVIVMVNEQFEAAFGYTRSELLGQSLEVLLPQRFRDIHTLHRDRYFSAPRTRPMGAGLQLFGLRKDGTEFPVDISLKPLVLDSVLHVLGAIRDVTMQRLAERERLQQVQHIRLQAELLNQAHDAILTRDPINRVLSWNKGAEKLYGWTEQEALGRVTHNLLKTRFPISRSTLDALLEQRGEWEGELTHTCRDGSTVIVESRQVLVRDETGQPLAILEINRDITKRRRLEQAEQVTHTETAGRLVFLQQVLDTLPGSVYLVQGSDARLLFANSAASRIWGAQWPVDQPMLEFLRSNGIEIVNAQGLSLAVEQLATLRAVRQGEVVAQHQETIRHSDGTHLPVLVNAAPVALPPLWNESQRKSGPLVTGTEPVALVVHQDVTALKEAEYLKDEFVGIAAHELRTPLAVLAGYADMLMTQTKRGHGPQLADWQLEALQEIKQATTRLATLTEDLLDVTRLQAGRLTLQQTLVNVVALVQRVATQMQQMTALHQVEVCTSHSELRAHVDVKRAEQVLMNLIGNAIKYSPQGGPILITIKEEPMAQGVQIRVQDKGIGIPKHQQAQIFGRFIRADNALAWGISGTGLGLYLCRELVERQGGRLWFESEEGVGSTFFVSLP